MKKYPKGIALGIALAIPVPAAAQDPRGLFIGQSTPPGGENRSSTVVHPAVRLGIELDVNGRSQPVPQNHRFRAGDRFRISFQLNGGSRYVYVVYRSIEGDPDNMSAMRGTKGLNLVSATDASGNGSAKTQAGTPQFHLLWPSAGGSARMSGGQTHTIPELGQAIEFDASSGMEKLSLLFSPYEVTDLNPYFPGLGRRPKVFSAGGRLDTDEEVLAQLENLGTMDGNTTTVSASSSRGICVGDCNQYSAPKNPERPFIITVDLLHAR